MASKKMIGIGLALVVVPCLFGLYIELAYRIALQSGRLPFGSWPPPLWWVITVALISFGCFLMCSVMARKFWLPLILGYLIAMTPLLLFIQFKIACFNGDCL